MTGTRRRKQRRLGLLDLVADGCACRPTMIAIPRPFLPAGVTEGLYVEHQEGCPLGESVLPANRAGILPVIFATGDRRCER